MKAKHVILYFLVSIIISSCIRDEALNAEADILSCTLPKAVMTTRYTILIYRKNTLSQQPTEYGKKHIQFRLLIRNLQPTTTSRTLSVGKNTIYS